jgi:hypothetical protein
MTKSSRGRPKIPDIKVLLRSVFLHAVTMTYKLSKGWSKHAALRDYFNNKIIKCLEFKIWSDDFPDKNAEDKMLKDLENALQNRGDEIDLVIGWILVEGKVSPDISELEMWEKIASLSAKLLEQGERKGKF